MANVSRPAPNKPRDRRLEEGEYQKLMDAMSSCRNELIKPIVQFAPETAMRRGEILSLRWNDVDLNARVALLADTKNGESRRVPLSSNAIEILNRFQKKQKKYLMRPAIVSVWHLIEFTVEQNLRVYDFMIYAIRQRADYLK